MTTIPTFTIISFGVALILTTIVPLLLLLVLSLKKKITVMPTLLGVAAFFGSQIIVRLPLLSILGTQEWYLNFARNNNILFIILIGGLTAGLFEETARYGGAKILKTKTTYQDAISFGLGHAFCEVIMLNGMGHINNILFSVLINSGNTSLLVGIDVESLAILLSEATPMMIAVGVFERIPAIVFHIFATLLVFKAVNEKKITYYVYAILAHTILNAGVALMTQYTNVYIGEAFFVAMAIPMVVYILKSRKEPCGSKTLSE